MPAAERTVRAAAPGFFRWPGRKNPFTIRYLRDALDFFVPGPQCSNAKLGG